MGSKRTWICVRAALLCIALLLVNCDVFADVRTVSSKVDEENTVYIAGNIDFYPIEYYDDDTGSYEGVMPRIFKHISESTGINFTYIHNDMTQEELARTKQVDIVSGYITDSRNGYVKNPFTILSCIDGRKNIKIGWGYTENTDAEIIRRIENCANNITEQQLNGYMLLSSNGGRKTENSGFIVITVLYGLLLAFILVFVMLMFKRAKEQHRKDMLIDFETGIGNVVYFEDCFDKLITDEKRKLYYVAYIVIDSNYLQTYHGETIFKDSMKYTAGVLKTYLKEGEFAARITDNGFAFAYKSTSEEEAEVVIREVMDKLNIYIEGADINSQHYFYTALYSLQNEDDNCELLLFNLRKNCLSIIDTEQQFIMCDSAMMTAAADEKKFLDSMIKGFKNNEIKLYLQFIVNNKTKNIVSAEALSRWESPQLGIVMPGRYIKAMEVSGYITLLDYYMFEACCRQLHKWKDKELDALSISCNITRVTLSEPDFIDKITSIAKKYVFDTRKLLIEITEDMIEKNFECAIDNIRKCKELGYRIALDDMGAGYTSLLNVCDYPIDIIKIDRDILLKADNKNGKGMFVGIIALAHSLGLKVICEGVETEEQKAFVDGTECDYVQGWYYSQVFPDREGEEFAKEKIKKQIDII